MGDPLIYASIKTCTSAVFGSILTATIYFVLMQPGVKSKLKKKSNKEVLFMFIVTFPEKRVICFRDGLATSLAFLIHDTGAKRGAGLDF